MNPRFSWAVVCDQIRKEDNGKHILIGVYGNAIYPREFPANMSLALYAHLSNPVEGDHDFEFQVVLDEVGGESKLVTKANLSLHIEEPLPPLSLDDGMDIALRDILAAGIEGPGILRFQVRGDSRRWRTIHSVLVDHRPKAEIRSIS